MQPRITMIYIDLEHYFIDNLKSFNFYFLVKKIHIVVVLCHTSLHEINYESAIFSKMFS